MISSKGRCMADKGKQRVEEERRDEGREGRTETRVYHRREEEKLRKRWSERMIDQENRMLGEERNGVRRERR